jgi:hypothetical protein
MIEISCAASEHRLDAEHFRNTSPYHQSGLPLSLYSYYLPEGEEKHPDQSGTEQSKR